jgi:hypothetical protein
MQTIQNIHQLKFMEAKELWYYMIELLYLIQVNPLQILEQNLLLPLLIKNTRWAIHIIAIYKPPFLSLMTFLSTIQNFISNSSTICHTFILGDFNVDVLPKKKLQKQHIYSNLWMWIKWNFNFNKIP